MLLSLPSLCIPLYKHIRNYLARKKKSVAIAYQLLALSRQWGLNSKTSERIQSGLDRPLFCFLTQLTDHNGKEMNMMKKSSPERICYCNALPFEYDCPSRELYDENNRFLAKAGGWWQRLREKYERGESIVVAALLHYGQLVAFNYVYYSEGNVTCGQNRWCKGIQYWI